MPIRTEISSALVIGLVGSLSACGTPAPASPEACTERFARNLAAVPEGKEAQTFFTYDVTNGSIPDEAMRTAKQLTFAHGNSDQSVAQFYANKDKVGPAIFGAEDISLYRSALVVGPPADALEAGCKPPFEGARLVRVDWHIISSTTEDTE